jgi:hypothetical protein
MHTAGAAGAFVVLTDCSSQPAAVPFYGMAACDDGPCGAYVQDGGPTFALDASADSTTEPGDAAFPEASADADASAEASDATAPRDATLDGDLSDAPEDDGTD